ncbi:hypothetical protein SAMN04488540_103198 [Ferrimonas sediminum]|uniref:Uncharacterized protein n=1 Tax=Ferrimonas sediminum TaxID=718193 RepID=A0A1G8NQM5_9GAMM|nr:hypothetical protein SAMN04488540_103198 [Ferrimonas sediminum]
MTAADGQNVPKWELKGRSLPPAQGIPDGLSFGSSTRNRGENRPIGREIENTLIDVRSVGDNRRGHFGYAVKLPPGFAPPPWARYSTTRVHNVFDEDIADAGYGAG